MAWGYDHHDQDNDLHLEEAHQRRLRWASLTEEEKALEIRRQRAADRWFTYSFGFTTVLVLLNALAAYTFHQGRVEQILAFGAFPAALGFAGVLAMYKRGQVK